MTVAAPEIIAAITAALKEFGKYSYYDKGADEVMDVGVWEKKLHAMGAEEAAKVLIEVLEFEHGGPFVESVVSGWDERDDFDALLDAHPDLADMY